MQDDYDFDSGNFELVDRISLNIICEYTEPFVIVSGSSFLTGNWAVSQT